MGTRLLGAITLLCCVLVSANPAAATPGGGRSVALPGWNRSDWWRGCASLDLDFYNDRYYLNDNTSCDGTTGTTYSGVTNFITGAGATFTRAGTTNVTSISPPFYLNTATQSFVSRASVTNNVTAYTAPFFIGTTGNGPSQSWVSRSSSATYFDSTGTLQTASSGTARSSAYYYNGSSWVLGGTLIEPAASNQIPNNTMFGGSSPSTLPTGGWGVVGSLNGLTETYAYGSENGLNYVDITLSGTATASGTSGLYQYSPVVAIGQTWTYSFYIRQSGGTTTNVTGYLIDFDEKLNGTTNLVHSQSSVQSIPTTTSLDLTRATRTYTITNANTIYVTPYFLIAYNPGTINFTLRIGMPQMEQNPYATSVIATSGSTVTRAADVYNQQPASYFDSTGTLYFGAANTARTNYYYSSGSWVLGGTLIEPASSNYATNSTMVGAVAGDGVEHVSNNTFSGCSGSTCTGWSTTLNGGSGSVSFSSGTATLTGDGTHSASIYQAISTTAGQPYIVVVVGNGSASAAMSDEAGTTQGSSNLGIGGSLGTYGSSYFAFTATGSTTYIQINNSGTTSFNVTSVSVQLGSLPGGPGATGYSGAAVGGLNFQMIGAGTEYGMNYIDIRYYGTTGASSIFMQLLFPSASATTVGQVWSAYAYARLVGGSASGFTFAAFPRQNTGCSPTFATLSSTLTQYKTTSCYTPSGTTSETLALQFNYASNTALNFTIRIYAVQLESSSYVTSPIPTSRSAVTRTADVYSNPNGGTYFNGSGVLTNAAANTPRLDHNPASPFSPRGILMEEGRTNLISYSVPDGGTNWTYAADNTAGTADATTAPDGTTTAASLADTSTSGTHYATPTAAISVTSGTAYNFSVFVKPSTATDVQLTLPSPPFASVLGGAPYADFNLTTGTIATGATSSATIQALNNGWYRLSLYGTANSTSTTAPIIALTNNSTSDGALPSYSGSGESLYIWGAQFEAGQNPTSFIPTYGSTVARATDVFTVPGTAGGGSGWLSNNVGTLGTEGSLLALSGKDQGFAGLDNGTAAQSIYDTIGSAGNRAGYFYSSGSTYVGTVSGYTAGATTKLALTFSPTYENGAGDGTAFNTNGTYAPPATQSRLTIGHTRNSIGDLDGWVSRIWYLPVTVCDICLQDYTR